MRFNAQRQQIVYSLPFRVTKEMKLFIFQYKISNNILYTNNILHKIKKKPYPYRPYCTMVEQTISHLLFSCYVAKSFWSEITTWFNLISPEKKFTVPKNGMIYGVFDDWSSCLTLDHLNLIGKYFIYTNTLDGKRPQFADFITLVQDKIGIEKYIALMIDKNILLQVMMLSQFPEHSRLYENC